MRFISVLSPGGISQFMSGPGHGDGSDFSLLEEVSILVLDLPFPVSFYQHYHS